MKCAVFVSTDSGYVPYVNALLNSLAKHDVHARCGTLDVFLIHDGLPERYLQTAATALPYHVIPIRIDEDPLASAADWSSAWKCKASRYYYMRKFGGEYDAACLLDADLFVVSPGFANLFHLVAGTGKAIGCNERIKWCIGPIYRLNNAPLFEEPVRFDKFHCNAPFFLDVNHWSEVLEEYGRLVFRGREHRPEKQKIIGDLFSWNIAVYRQHRQQDIVLFPMETMTQVHQSGYRGETRLKLATNGYWTTPSGDEVFSIHARPDKPGFRKVDFGDDSDTQEAFETYARLVEREWYNLNFKQCVLLSDFYPMSEKWSALE